MIISLKVLCHKIKRGARKVAKTMYDPWSKITTKNGYAGDEVISALQKSIRRGLEEQACMFAYEMYISSPQFCLLYTSPSPRD